MNRIKKTLTYAIMALALACFTPTLVPSQQTVVEAASVKLNKSKATLIKGKTLQLKVTGTKKTVKWKSSNKKIATVSSKGKVTAKKKGTAKITASVDGKKLTCKITVETPKLSNKTLTLAVGASSRLTVTGNTQKIKWSSGNTKVAKISSDGKVTAVAPGSAVITAKIGTYKMTCTVTVEGSDALENYEDLVDFLRDYGKVNNDGNKFFSDSEYDEDGDNNLYGFLYDEDEEELKFSYFITDDETGTYGSVEMYLDPEWIELDGAYIEYIYIDKEYVFSFNATAVLDNSTFTNDTTVKFTPSKGYEDDNSPSIQSLCNTTLKLAFLYWDEFLEEETGLTLEDLGFIRW